MRRPTAHPARTRARALACGLVALATASGLAGAVEAGDRLSDAAKEAAKPPSQQQILKGSEKPPVEDGPSIGISFYSATSVGTSAAPVPRGPGLFAGIHVGAVAQVSSLSSPDFAPATLYGLRVGTTDRGRAMVDLVLLGGPARFTPGSDIDRLFRAPHEIGLEGSVRYSLTPANTGLGIAPVVGFRVGLLSWRYLNPIQVERYGDVYDVGDDGVWHYSPHLGLAFTALRSRHLELGLTAITGWRFYGDESLEGLQNDLFGETRFNELRLETRIRF